MEFAVDHRTPSLSSPPSRTGDRWRTEAQRADALRDVLAELGERVKPITLARERTLPVAAPFDQLLPDEGLVRGRVLSCRGVAETSLAFGVIAEALKQGAWAAVVDVATFGADAASEFGIPLERVVRVDSGGVGEGGVGELAAWSDVMGAAVDGFDVVVTKVPAELRGAAVRKLATRIQQKGSVVVVLGESGALGSDLVFSTDHTNWSGISSGAGHLRSRVITVAAGGRRLPTARTVPLLIDAASGRVACSVSSASAVGVGTDLVVDIAEHLEVGRDPQAELLAEMADSLDVANASGVTGAAGVAGALDAADDDDHRLAG